MNSKSNIIEELREEEKQGLLKSSYQNSNNEYLISEELKEDSNNDFTKDCNKIDNKEIQSILSEKKFRLIIEKTSDLISLTTFSFNPVYTYVSPSFNRILGFESRELIGKNAYNLLHPDDQKNLKPLLKKYLSAKFKQIITRKDQDLVERFECRMRDKSGNWHFIKSTANLIGNEILFIAKDITDSKKNELEVIDWKNRYEVAIKSSGHLLYDWNSITNEVTYGGALEEILGYSNDEIKGDLKRWIELIHPDEKKYFKDTIKHIISSKEPVHLNFRVKKKNGEYIWVEDEGSFIIDSDGNITHMVGFVKDITSRITAEKELQKLASVVKHSTELVNLATLDGKMIFINEAGSKMLGIDTDDVNNHSIYEVIPDELQEKVKNEVVKSILKKGNWVGELQYKNIKTGKITDVHAQTFIIKDSKTENPLFLANVSLDITDRKFAENKLNEAHKKLQKMNKDLENKVKERTEYIEQLLIQKDEFINQLGHDLKNPLGPLLNLIPILDGQEKNLEKKNLFSIINRNVEYMRNLVVKTIELARLNSPNTQFLFEDIDLLDEIKKIIQQSHLIFKNNNIKVVNNISKNLIVNADKLRIEELINNILDNSVKYTKNSGTITFNCSNDENFVILSIQDTGIGMTEEQISKIFDEFYKADPSRHDFESSGLGMSICKRIVKKHGGKIWIESEGLRKGITVKFSLKKENSIS